jgi:quercetin dioxygenase-like cupin family protein
MATITKVLESLHDGKGHAIMKSLLGSNELDGKCGLYAEFTLNPKCSIGYHEHKGESETYYILSGEGEYNDNGVISTVRPGDVTFTQSESSHGLENVGNSDLVFMALIIKGNN